MSERYRYPGGGYSFTEEDETIFCGRKEAIDYIHNSILLNQCVVLYGKSGTGKSSLLQAGVIPQLCRPSEQKPNNNFHIYSVRTGIWQYDSPSPLVQRIRNLKLYKGIAPSKEKVFLPFLSQEVKNTLWYRFKMLQYNTYKKEQEESNSNKRQDTYLIIIDQVEELFTYPIEQFAEMIQELADLRSQILPDKARDEVEIYERENSGELTPLENEILYSTLPVKFIFSIRSDKLYLMGRLKKAIPSILHNTFELYPFSKPAAIKAIVKPSNAEGNFASPKFDLSEVADYIADFLENQPDTELEYVSTNCTIEPFALQIICRHVEKIIINNRETKVTREMIPDLKDLFVNYYLNTLKELPLDDSMKSKVQQLIEDKMIYEKYSKRISVFREIIKDFGIDEDSLQKVINSRLIKETEPGSYSYEIIHDSLIIPILDAKRNRLQAEDDLNKKYDATSRNIFADKSIEIVEIEMRKNRYDYKLFKNRADSYYLKQEFSKALDDYIKAIELLKDDQFDEDLYIGIANCQYNMKEYEESNKTLRILIQKKPENMFAWYYTGFNYHVMRAFDKAIEYYLQALDIKPLHKELNYNLALAYLETKNYSAAIGQFEKVIEYYPDDYLTYFSLIETLIFSGDNRSIKAYTDKLIELHVDQAETYRQIADMYSKKGNKAKAIEYFKETLNIEPENPSYHVKIGIVYSELEMLPEAIAHFEKACEYDNRNSFYTTWLAFTYQLVGNEKKAIELFHNAIEYDPHYRYPVAALAACYRRIGDLQSYAKYIDIAKSLPPNDSEDEYSLASFEALIGNSERALELLENALRLRLREPGFVEADPDFEFVKEYSRFKQIIENSKANLSFESLKI
ncbi:tetratricopeptide repeat protein [Pinibacter aurantiacus]|uniref:Tetratricopeptide repeat protein n=1 Tax=Pinibacter aurantiacus TaxID=2851599 RepID=A0A9E2SFE1_9BACT|nr:tetratricopeptide repeat protein [Pinibacter aurantiacus]MBV4360478.1 tetratricopeptide repeat protein [Pinibacter aurantiacus]